MREYIKCPAHADNNPSCMHYVNSNGSQMWKCFAGCTGEALGRALGLVESDGSKVVYGDSHVWTGKPVFNHGKNYVINLATLAADKGISEEELASFYCREESTSVAMDYVGEDDRTVLCTRYRHGLSGKTVKSKAKAKNHIYGEWFLDWNRLWAGDKGGLILVEGESDCWTLWANSFLAYGIPGATNTKVIELKHVSFSPKVYIWCEPDHAGRVFVQGCVSRLRELNYAGKILILQHPKHKDPNAWHKADNEFKSNFRALLRNGIDPDEFLSTPEVLTEMRVAEKWVARCGDTYKYNHTEGCWYVFDKGVWCSVTSASKDTPRVIAELTSCIRALKQDAEMIRSREEREAFIKQLNKFEAVRTLNAIAQGASNLSYLLPSEMDKDPWLFNMTNGTYNIKTGEFLPHDPANAITKQVAYPYDPSATCPTIDKFLDDVTVGDKDLKTYLINCIGLCLTGIPKKLVWFLHGEGDSGKSTLMKLVRELCSQYSTTINAATLIKATVAVGGNAAREDIYALKGARLAICEEVPSKYLEPEVLKNLTSLSTITARPNHGKMVEFPQTWKVWMEGNNLPVIEESENAIWNRLTVIPFRACFPKGDAKTDEFLMDKMRNELSGFFNQCVASVQQDFGIMPPKCVLDKTQEARDTNALVMQFLEEVTAPFAGERVSKDVLYSNYQNWSKRNGYGTKSNRSFGTLASKRLKGDKRWWYGISIICTKQEVAESKAIWEMVA